MKEACLVADNRYAIILAGGSGTRLWPLSRSLKPKQLLALHGTGSLLQQTVRRTLPMVASNRIMIVTQEAYRFEVADQLRIIAPALADQILAEPMGRNTLPAIAWAVLRIRKENPEAIIAVFSSDHAIEDEVAFRSAWRCAEQAAQQDYLALLGMKPDYPATGYGYIQANESIHSVPAEPGGPDGPLRVSRFIEKPDFRTAQEYVAAGGYFWNGGIFVFRAEYFWQQLLVHQQALPELLDELENSAQAAGRRQLYERLPDVSIDYGLLEKAERLAVVPVEMGWSDLGTWEAVYQKHAKDTLGNSLTGNVIQSDCQDNLLWSEFGCLAVLGVRDLAVVQTRDATLICPRERAQEIKDIVHLAKSAQPEIVTAHPLVTRPWGSYMVIDNGPQYKVKRIIVNPGEKLSMQLHYHRSEHWIVVAGTAKITVGDTERYLDANESTYISKVQRHRLENPGRIPLEIIEIQSGPYLEEDDIVRFDDIYGRSLE